MSQINVDRIVDSSGGVFAPVSSVFKNRIINGACVIDQRNAGASVTPTASGYTLDRWGVGITASSKFSIQQLPSVSITTAPPVGFTNYLGVTSLSSYSVLSSDILIFRQFIEGYNVADLGWGTANAKTITVSFWVRSSLTGTFGGSIQNDASNRSYPFTYSISAANTWEQKSITIAGDTTGTWLTTNSSGIRLNFGLGVGSTFSGTAGAWAGSDFRSATGATSVVGTNGATFYITGVQLEVGTQATSFEYRQYGTELALCQRYYYKNSAPNAGEPLNGVGGMYSSTLGRVQTFFPVKLRSAPTSLEQTGTASNYAVLVTTSGTPLSAVPTFQSATTDLALTDFTVASGGAANSYAIIRANASNAYLAWSAEL
jgi:hypothetical protein